MLELEILHPVVQNLSRSMKFALPPRKEYLMIFDVYYYYVLLAICLLRFSKWFLPMVETCDFRRRLTEHTALVFIASSGTSLLKLQKRYLQQ